MFSIFRKNDPYLYVIYAIAVIITRLLYFLFSENSMATGIAQEGNHGFYDLFVFYTENRGLSISLNGLIILANAVLFNQLILANNALRESNYTPGFVFILLMSSFQEAFIFSGILIGLAFLLFSLFLILGHVKQRASEENIFFTGFFLGLAGIAFKPYAWFFICLLIIYFLYTRTIIRRYFLGLFGFLFPHLIIFTISKFTDLQSDYTFWMDGVNPVFELSLWLGYQPLVILPAFFIAFYELIVNYTGIKMTNHQIHFQRVMTTILVYSMALYFLFGLSVGGVMLSVIPITFFVSMAIGNAQKVWVREAVSLLIIIFLVRPYL